MVELTIQHNWGKWLVRPKYETANRMVHPIIDCDTSEEAWVVFEQLNGKSLVEIENFIKARRRLGV